MLARDRVGDDLADHEASREGHHHPEKGDEERTQSDWVLVSRDPAALKGPLFDEVKAEAPEERPEWRTWTDDYSNLVQILK